MKKLILFIGLGLATIANAQNWSDKNFLSDRVVALIVSNAVSGTVGAKGITNLYSTTSQGGLGPGTNIASTSWIEQLSDIGSNAFQATIATILPPWKTNGLYTNYVVTALDATTNTFGNRNLLDPMVSLWTDRNGAGQPILPVTTGVSNAFGTIMVRTVGTGGSATNPVTCVIEGVPWADGAGNYIGTTLPAERFVFLAGVSNGVIVTVTNFPAYKYIGFKGMRIGSLSMANGDAGTTNQAYVTDFKFLGFVP